MFRVFKLSEAVKAILVAFLVLMALLLSFGLVTEVSAAGTGRIIICKSLSDQNGNLVLDTTNLPQGSFVVKLATSPDINASTIKTATWDIASFNPNIKLLDSAQPDAECHDFNDLEFGTYYYSQEIIVGDSWSVVGYNDQFNPTSDNSDEINNLADYDSALFNNDSSDDEFRNRQSDGSITIMAGSGPARERFLFLANEFTAESVPTPMPIGGDQCEILDGNSGWYGEYFDYSQSHPDMELPGTQWNVNNGDPLSDVSSWQGDWYDNQYFKFWRVDNNLDFGDDFFPMNAVSGAELIDGKNYHFGVHWQAQITVPENGNYAYILSSDDDAWVYINGELIDDNDRVHPVTTVSNSVNLNQGTYKVDVYFAERHTNHSFMSFRFIDERIEIVPIADQCPLPENTPPVITLIGDNPMTIIQGHQFTDPGATANDLEDGDITDDIIASGEVDVNVVGSYTITYNVSDSEGLAAIPVTRMVEVVLPQCLAPEFINLDSVSGTVDEQLVYNLQATGTAPFDFMVATSTPLPAGLSLSGNTISGIPTISGTTTVKLLVSNSCGLDEDYLTIVIAPKPIQCTPASFGEVSDLDTQVGEPLYYTVPVAGTAPVSLSVFSGTPLPAGLTLGGFSIIGTTTEAGVYDVKLIVENSCGSEFVWIKITVAPEPPQCVAPTVTSSLSASATVGESFSYSMTATGTEPLNFILGDVNGLPEGLNFENGVISGTPTEFGIFEIDFKAKNDCGFDLVTLVLTIERGGGSCIAPNITSATSTAGVVGQAFEFVLDASGTPSINFSISSSTPLPDGLDLVNGNKISGVPTIKGTFEVEVVAENNCGFDNISLVIEIGSNQCEIFGDQMGWYGEYFDYSTNHPDMQLAPENWGDDNGDPLSYNSSWQGDWYDQQYLKFWRVDSSLDFGASNDSFFPLNSVSGAELINGNNFHFGVHWQAQIIVPVENNYSYALVSDDDTWVYIDGELVAENPGIHPATTISDAVYLTAGVHKVDVFFAERRTGGSTMSFKFHDQGLKVIPFTQQCPLPENTPPVITLIGNDPLEITVGSLFTDPGATALDEEDGDITDDIVATGTVDNNTVGTYEITYNVSDSEGLAAIPVTRTVNVVSRGGEPNPECSDDQDNDGDQLIDEDDPACHTDGNPENPDSYDPDIDDENSRPVITLVGDNPIIITVGNPFTDPGATANDLEDGDLTDDIVTSGTVDNGVVGSYNIIYNVSDSDGLAATPVARAVNVIPSDDDDDNGGGGGGGNIISYTPPTTGQVLSATSCYYLRDFLKIDWNNDPIEVIKLQAFLRSFEGFNNLAINGVFDQATFAAVSAFQLRYFDDVLAPWGHEDSTGFVYITTRKKVNEIFCQRAFPVTGLQQAEIDAFRTFIASLRDQGVSLNLDGSSAVGSGTVSDAGAGALAGISLPEVVGEIGEAASTTATETTTTLVTRNNFRNFAAAVLAMPSTWTGKINCGLTFLLVLALIYVLGTLIANLRAKDAESTTTRRSRKMGYFIVGTVLALIVATLAQIYCVIVPLLIVLIILSLSYLWYSNRQTPIINKELDLTRKTEE